MSHWLALFTLSLAASFGVACNGPFVVFPGGQLDGEARPAPTRWSLDAMTGTAQLETNPSTPYSVNLSYTVIDGTLYLNAGDSETQWVRNITANPDVRLRVDGLVYEARANRVTDRAEIESFGANWTQQSMFRRDPAQFPEVWIYRLIPR